MEDVKWLLKKYGFLILIVLIAVIAGIICWGRLSENYRTTPYQSIICLHIEN